MKITVEKTRLMIIPETPQDEVMLEESFGLKKEGDSVPLVRRDICGKFGWECAEVKKQTLDGSVCHLCIGEYTGCPGFSTTGGGCR